MKRLLAFSAVDFSKTSKPLDFSALDGGGFELTAMLFSTAYNRNKVFFQVSGLLKWVNKLESILNDLNHDLSLTNNQYFGIKDTKLVKLWHTITDGELEIWCVLQTCDPVFISYLPQITAPSIELMVDDDDMISNGEGEYYTEFDWVGIGWLLGVVAGSGNARITEIKEFNLLQHFNITNDMTKEEVQTLLDAQDEKFTTEFKTQTESILKIFQEVVEAIKPVETPTPEATPELIPEVTPEVTAPEVTPEIVEEDPELKKIENQLNTKAAHEAKMASFRSEEKVTDLNGAGISADAKVYSSASEAQFALQNSLLN